VSYKLVFDAEEAVKFSQGKMGKGSNMGNDYFCKLLDSEAEKGADEDSIPYTTYHLGDAHNTGDFWSAASGPSRHRGGRCAEHQGMTRND
jgi:hypothetical protein